VELVVFPFTPRWRFGIILRLHILWLMRSGRDFIKGEWSTGSIIRLEQDRFSSGITASSTSLNNSRHIGWRDVVLSCIWDQVGRVIDSRGGTRMHVYS